MLRSKLQYISEGFYPLLQGLARQAVHQIKGQIPETEFPNPLYCINCTGIIMGSAQFLECFIIIALDAKAHPVKALTAQSAQQPVGHGVGVWFEGDLRGTGYVKAFPDGIQDGGKTLCTEERGCAAAKIDGIHQIVRGKSSRLPDMGSDGLQIAVQ